MDSPKMNMNEEIKESSRSDISAFTDMKVFQGYLGSNDLFKRLNENQNSNKTNNNTINSSNIQSSKIKKNLLPSSSNSTTYLSKMNEYKDESITCNKDQPQLYLLKNFPLESPVPKGHLDFISFGNGAELTSGKQSSLIVNTNNDEDNKSNTSRQSRKSKKSNMSLNDPQEENGISPMKAFITTLNDEEDPDVNSEDRGNNRQNIFWKMRHQNEEMVSNDSNKNIEDYQQPLKTFKKIIDSFTISKIEKGIALLVSCEDCIFTLPTFLLPHGAKIGNIYKLSIEENSSLFESEKIIRSMQKKLLDSSIPKE